MNRPLQPISSIEASNSAIDNEASGAATRLTLSGCSLIGKSGLRRVRGGVGFAVASVVDPAAGAGAHSGARKLISADSLNSWMVFCKSAPLLPMDSMTASGNLTLHCFLENHFLKALAIECTHTPGFGPKNFTLPLAITASVRSGTFSGDPD